jgi:hypothetical protein
MRWKCPACSTPIRHSEIDATPRQGVVYRCPVCRLELTLDDAGTNFTLVPLPIERPVQNPSDHRQFPVKTRRPRIKMIVRLRHPRKVSGAD